MGRVISYRPGKKVKIVKGLFSGETAEIDDIVVQRGKPLYKLVGRRNFYTPSEVRLIKKRSK